MLPNVESSSSTPAIPLQPQDAAPGRLEHALARGEANEVVACMATLARAQGISRVSRETGLRRENLYRTLDGSDVKLGTFLKLLRVAGLRLRVEEA